MNRELSKLEYEDWSSSFFNLFIFWVGFSSVYMNGQTFFPSAFDDTRLQDVGPLNLIWHVCG